jgi:hypothetical protein
MMVLGEKGGSSTIPASLGGMYCVPHLGVTQTWKKSDANANSIVPARFRRQESDSARLEERAHEECCEIYERLNH